MISAFEIRMLWTALGFIVMILNLSTSRECWKSRRAVERLPLADATRNAALSVTKGNFRTQLGRFFLGFWTFIPGMVSLFTNMNTISAPPTPYGVTLGFGLTFTLLYAAIASVVDRGNRAKAVFDLLQEPQKPAVHRHRRKSDPL